MAAALLKQLGEKALHPVKVGDIWHKAAISAKNLAKERRIALLEGRYLLQPQHSLTDALLRTDANLSSYMQTLGVWFRNSRTISWLSAQTEGSQA